MCVESPISRGLLQMATLVRFENSICSFPDAGNVA